MRRSKSRIEQRPIAGRRAVVLLLERPETLKYSIVAAHAFVQNLRRGFYDLGTDVPPPLRLTDAFAELALVI